MKYKGREKEYRREYNIKRYYRIKQALIDFLGGKCKKCGGIDRLEFDHIDPATKEFDICPKITTITLKKLYEEVRKCQLLCKKCHNQKTIKENGLQDATKIHGTLSSYRHCRCDLCKKAKSDYSKEYHKTHIRKRDREKAPLAQLARAPDL